jgi:hypothetical protein
VCDALLDWNAQTLVQRDQPVLIRGFVEERALDRHSAPGKDRPDMWVRFERRRKPPADSKIEQISGARPPSACTVECSDQLGALVASKHAGNLGKPGLIEH